MSSRLKTILTRCAAVAGALVLWFWTQSLISARGFPAGCVGDGIHDLTAPLHGWLVANPHAADLLLISSSFVIDLTGIFLLGSAIFGPSLRPFIGLFAIFFLRQGSQLITALPPPEGMIWRYPGFPSLLVTYGVSTDLFFSGHTSIAVWGGLEVARLRFAGARLLGAFIACFEAGTVLVLRAHYTMDVFTGIVVALLIAFAADKLASCRRTEDTLLADPHPA